MLTKEQQTTLLRIAREAIAGELHGCRFDVDVDRHDEPLRRAAGAFVTLRTRDRQLRGCIGSVLPAAPLCRAVATSAVNAAFRDPRFLPLRLDELPQIEVEISVLGPPIRVADPAEIVCGRDGLIVSHGSYAGLLLPQVATEQGWDRDTFLSRTCSKAGLEAGAWRSPAVRIDRFEAYVFAEQRTEQ